MKNEPLHNVLSYSDWPKVPKEDHPAEGDSGLEINLATVVREVLDSVRHEPSHTPERQVHIRNFRSTTYKLTDDLVVMIEETDDGFVARSYDTGQYGVGVSSDDAIGHLCAVLEEYYEILQEERGNLSRPLESHLHYLDGVLAR
jgi:hypothetical protein